MSGSLSNFTPGTHYVVITSEVPRDGVQARTLGLELRDSMAIFMPGRVLHALLLRVPLREKTVAAQVLATGTGAINVDGCRTTTEPRSTGHTGGQADSGAHGRYGKHVRPNQQRDYDLNKPSGRWPSNVILVHGPGCICEGTRKVKGSGTSKSFHEAYEGDSSTQFLRGWSHPGNQHADEDGKETVAAWDCQPDCPVKLLDSQSGEATSSNSPATNRTALGVLNDDGWSPKAMDRQGYSDTGGASRFFPQFESLKEAIVWLNKLIQFGSSSTG